MVSGEHPQPNLCCNKAQLVLAQYRYENSSNYKHKLIV